MLNLVVLEGILARPASCVELPSGDRVLALEVTVRRLDGPAEPVPVSWTEPPAWALALDAGAEIVVLGRVRRRFFRAGGVTQSRTEVVVHRAARAGARSRKAALFAEAAALLDETGEGR